MSLGFSVKVIENNTEKVINIRKGYFSIGNDYRNSVVLPIAEKEIKLIELKENSLILYQNNRVETVIFSNNTKYELSELLKLFPNTNVIKLKTDCRLSFKIDNFEFFIKVVEFKEERKKALSATFKKKFFTKENIKFSILTSVITTLLLSITGVAAYRFKQIKPKKVEIVETKGVDEREIGYSLKEKMKKQQTLDTEPALKSKESGRGEKTKAAVKEPVTGAFIATAPAEVPKQGGVLAVQEGAKSVIIKRERSLFSKLDEALELPVPKKEDVTIGETDKKSFQAAKVEDIHAGPVKKEIKVELDETEKLKVQQRATEVKVVVGKRPEVEITTTLGKYKKGFEFIFIDERKRDPNLKGKVVIFFVVDNSGSVSKAEVIETDIKNKEFLDKIITLVKSIKFPSSDKGDTSIKLPLLFFPS